MENYITEVNAFIDSHRDEMVSLWEELVNLQSYSKEKKNVDNVAKRLKLEFEKAGMECELIEVGENSGCTLVGTLGMSREKKPVLFSGHMDTVFPENSLGENPFYIKDGMAYGPGVLDMKGGIVIALYIIKALNSIGYEERPIKVVISGDEEVGHIGSSGSQAIMDNSKGGVCAFNMETGLVDNTLCVGRNGRISCKVTTIGVSTHAGNDFINGINAIQEMAHKILDIQSLTNLDEGTTFSVGVIKGGTVSNAIPSECSIEVDIRFEKSCYVDKIKAKLEEICSKTYLEGSKTILEFPNIFLAFDTTEKVLDFYNFVEQVVKDYNLPKINKKRLGGSSDACYITEAGVPVICSFGVRGQWNHTTKEYAIVESLFERAKFISTIILNLEKHYKE